MKSTPWFRATTALRRHIVSTLLAGLLSSAMWPPPLMARILVQESFEYGGASLPMGNLTANATGLAGAYAVDASGGGTSAYMPAGLTFSSNFFPSSSGCLRQSAPAAGSYTLVGAPIRPGTPSPYNIQALSGNLAVTGTPVYASYLVRFSSLSSSADADAVLRLGSVQLGGGSAWFSSEAETAALLKRPGTGYDGTPAAAPAGTLAVNTTYLVVTRFTNPGTILSAASPGAATLWMFTSSGYDSWFNAGAREDSLAAYASFTANETVSSGVFGLDNTRFLQLRVAAGTAGTAQTVDYDELRLGTSLGDVAPGRAFEPDGALPVTLKDLMPASWDLSSVTTRIWVAPGGTGNGSSPGSSLGSIQSAINQATPGTAIMVQAGNYAGTLTVNGSTSGTDASPILLVSADGIGAATISGAGETSTISGSKAKNIGLIGFRVSASANGTNSDSSPIKFGSTDATANTCYNWLVAGNTILGTGTDGMKTYKSRNVYWLGNTINGTAGAIKEEACDNVIVGVLDPSRDNNQFAFNTLQGNTTYSSITMKMGSNHYLVFNNDFSQGTWTSVRIGGDGDLKSHLGANQFPTNDPDYDSLTAKNVQVLFNRFHGYVTRNIQLYGAVDSTVSLNKLWDSNGSAPYTREISDEPATIDVTGSTANETFTSAYNTVTYNTINSTTENAFRVHGGAGGLTSTALATYTVHDNINSQPFIAPVGAPAIRPLLEELVRTLRHGASVPLLFDDFTDGNSNGWSLLSGNWAVGSGGGSCLSQTGTTGSALAVAGSGAWCTYDLAAKVRPLSVGGNGTFGLITRYADSANNYSFRYSNATGRIEIVRTVGGVVTVLQSKPYTMYLGTTYTFRAASNGALLNFSVNGTPELTVADATFSAGKVALFTSDSAAEFDEVLVAPGRDSAAYEPFNYGGAAVAMSGISSNATGLAGTYGTSSSGGTSTYQPTGLTFSPKYFPTAGGCLRQIAPAAGNSTLLGVALNAGTVFGAPLYGTCLVRFNSLSSAADATALLQIASTQLTGGTSWFGTEADCRTTSGAPGVGYDGSPSTAGTGLAANTTYLIVVRFTNVGKVLSTTSPGIADFWMFTAAGYESWLNAGALESHLSAHASFSATDTATSGTTYSFNNTRFLQFRTTAGTGGTTESVDFDELRFGGSLDSVIRR